MSGNDSGSVVQVGYRYSTCPQQCFIFRTVPQLGLERIFPELTCSVSELNGKVPVLLYPLLHFQLMLACLYLLHNGFDFNFDVDGLNQCRNPD